MSILSTAPESIGAIPANPQGMVIAGTTGAGPFFVEGGRSLVTGSQRGPLNHIAIDGTVVLRELTTELGSAANLLLYPGLARREFVGPGGTSIETVLSPPTLPFVAVQWSTSEGTVPGAIRFVIPAFPGGSEPERGASGVSVRGPDGLVVAAYLSPAPRAMTLSRNDAGDHVVTLGPGQDNPTTLIVSAGRSEEVGDALAATAFLSGHTFRAAAGPLEDGIVLETGVTELDDGFHWARIRVHHAMERLDGIDVAQHSHAESTDRDRARLMLGLAALVSGDPRGAVRLLSSEMLAGTPVRALLAARIAASTGDAKHALDHAEAILGGVPSVGDSDLALAGLARTLLADGLRHGAPEALIAALRTPLPSRGAGLAGGSGGGRSLPMVASPPQSDPWIRWVDQLLRGDPMGPIPTTEPREAATVRGSAALFRSDPDAAWVSWRGSLSEGLAGGPSGPAGWDPMTTHGRSGAPTAAELILAFGHGLLGIAQDAPAGRIRIAPRFPSHLTEFGVDGISLGTTTLRLDYRRTGPRHSFTLTPRVASVPPLVVFEPTVPGHVSDVRVDGEAADLELRYERANTTAPIQIPIDGERTVEITTG